MSVTKGIMSAIVMGTTAAQVDETLDLRECLALLDEGVVEPKFCLNADTLQSNSCCDSLITCAEDADGVNNCTPGCIQNEAQGLELCVTQNISNRWLQSSLQPARADQCWTAEQSKIIVSETGVDGMQMLVNATGYIFDTPMPAGSDDFHCHILAEIDGTTLSRTADDVGYLYMIAEQYCFKDWVKLIIQPHDQYLDFNFRSQTTDPALMTKAFRNQFGQRYLIPAEYDIFMDVSPYVGLDEEDLPEAGCDKGGFLFQVYHVSNSEAAALAVSTDKAYPDVEGDETTVGDLIEFVQRLAPLADDEPAAATAPNPETDDDSEYYEVIVNEDLPEPGSVSAIITVQQAEGTFFDSLLSEETLFTIGETDISAEQTFWAASGVLIIILVCVAICLACSYWKRKRIAAEARRASNYVRRSTATLRASIRKARGKPTPEDESKPMTDKEINKIANEQGATKNEKEFLKDMMKDGEEQKEGGFVELANNSVNVSSDNKISPAPVEV